MTTDTTGDRRKSPRTNALGQLQVRLLSRPMTAAVYDLGLGGFSIETSQRLAEGGTYSFSFQFVFRDDEAPVHADATCVHCTRTINSQGAPIYLAGFSFGPMHDGTRATLANLLGQIDQMAGRAVEPAVAGHPVS